MKCEDVQLRMIDYLDKTLEESVSQQIEKHLETCERCLDELRDTHVPDVGEHGAKPGQAQAVAEQQAHIHRS